MNQLKERHAQQPPAVVDSGRKSPSNDASVTNTGKAAKLNSVTGTKILPSSFTGGSVAISKSRTEDSTESSKTKIMTGDILQISSTDNNNEIREKERNNIRIKEKDKEKNETADIEKITKKHSLSKAQFFEVKPLNDIKVSIETYIN